MSTDEFKQTKKVGGLGNGASARALRLVFMLPSRLYRRGWGWLLGRHFLALSHTGRRTGALHTTVVEVVHRDPVRDEYIVMAAFGRHSDWYRNIHTNPARQVVVGRRMFTPVYRELRDQDAVRLLEDYEERRWWWGPLLPWLMTKLLGEPYRSTREHRLTVVRERPMIAFTPAERIGSTAVSEGGTDLVPDATPRLRPTERQDG